MGAECSCCPRQDSAGREVQSAGLVLILQREGGGGWTDVCILMGSEGGSLEPAEYKKLREQRKGCCLCQHQGRQIKKM